MVSLEIKLRTSPVNQSTSVLLQQRHREPEIGPGGGRQTHSLGMSKAEMSLREPTDVHVPSLNVLLNRISLNQSVLSQK